MPIYSQGMYLTLWARGSKFSFFNKGGAKKITLKLLSLVVIYMTNGEGRDQGRAQIRRLRS